ncbi:MAG: MTAP family purine nucleoside phosphorylase [Acidobacteria bacterium]|nr:MTAP family purine nucleoside phosphorylase [Acidobacteriota bacterium]
MATKLAIIGRTGLHKILEKYGASRISQQKIKTPFGSSHLLHSMIYQKIPFYCISRHGEEDLYEISAPFVDMRASLYALRQKGVEKVISISAPGSLMEEMGPGTLFVPDDIIDRSYSSKRTFFENRGIGVIRMDEPFCPSIRALMVTDLQTNFKGKVFDKGTYINTAGPRLETAAEIRDYTLLGGSAVGMTLAPEVFLAREMELCYAALCYPVNYAEGIAERPYKRGVLFEGLATEEELKIVKKIEEAIPQLVLNMIPKLEVLVRDCECKNALLRYKKRGDLPDDFSKWFE